MESPFIAKTCINDLDSTSKIIGKIEFVATDANYLADGRGVRTGK